MLSDAVRLSEQQKRIVDVLLQANGKWVSRTQIMRAMGAASTRRNTTLSVQIQRIRDKMAHAESQLTIETLHGGGYRIVQADDQANSKSNTS